MAYSVNTELPFRIKENALRLQSPTATGKEIRRVDGIGPARGHDLRFEAYGPNPQAGAFVALRAIWSGI